MRAGAASLRLDPPLGLPMLGFVRQIHVATGTGWPLETGAVVLEQCDTRAVLCGVDIIGLQEPAADAVVDRIADACECDPAGVLLSWNHTHLAPPGDERMARIAGKGADSDLMRRTAASIQDRMVEACRRARERLEPAEPVWAVGEVDEAVNRRERTSDGRTILGWNPARQLDRQVTALQLRRPDESPVASLVGFGCHPVTTGYDMDIYSADYPGPLRDLVRRVSGGECVFFQASAGNVVPKVSFTTDEREAERLGRRLALEALCALEGRPSVRREVVTKPEASMVPIVAYRVRELPGDAPLLAVAEQQVRLEFSDVPPLDEIVAQRAGYDAALARARAAGDVGAARVAMVGAHWGRITEQAVRSGSLETSVDVPVNAVRIGDGLLVTAPGETFTEIGMAVKQRSPATPTIFCGYTNGMVGYIPTTDEYRFGGHEPVLGNRAAGMPAVVAVGTDTALIRAGVRLAERLYPGCASWPEERGWTAAPHVPGLASSELQHPRR
jgi:neutral ceramidase